ncbi:hypothetical protein APY04_1859 [Hyphomicrobium sulfonivorans]|uniref:Uncharacterized protein n=1 Tax=Hyphomicrobium sulfonivorans TaxID=121290 RepID=A0A125NUS2_HYPSL|nr:hypothetical protein [Hyphomicrobium sulfonivorans]KWT67500.1 hypothetical protein APY04_1859 [Hyphomicrobium sulfonivorans]
MDRETDIQRYERIREQLDRLRADANELEEKLCDLAATHGLTIPFDKVSHSPDDATPRFNSWWVKTPDDWSCPCCRRIKPELLRAGRAGQALGILTSHHDHFRDLLDNIVAEQIRAVQRIEGSIDESARQFIRRFANGLVRFDDVVICQDCNNADAEAKRIVAAPAHLSFTPAEIAEFILIKPKAPHEINQERARSVAVVAKKHFARRQKLAESLARLVLTGEHWHEIIPKHLLPSAINHGIEARMRSFGIRELARWDVAEKLLTPRQARGNIAGWRAKKHIAAQPPSESEIEYVRLDQRQSWLSVPDDWRCPGCNRSKTQAIRPTNQNRWIFRAFPTRFNAGQSGGNNGPIVCDACCQVVKHIGIEARNDPEIGPWPVPFLSLDDLQAIIRPQPHSLHNVENDRLNDLFERLRFQSLSE